MAREHDGIDDELRSWIEEQPMFFVASAPLAADGHVNLSPKGLDTFRVLDDRTVAWLDLTGSGAETIAHVRENGRVCVMFCAFEGNPRILRLQGDGSVLRPGDDRYADLRPSFPDLPGERSILVVDVTRVATSCGFGVPLMTLDGQRTRLPDWAEARGPDGIADYQQSRNATSLDGLPSIT